MVLSRSRQTGMSIGSIPLPAIQSYIDLFGPHDEEEMWDFIHLVSVLDDVFVEHHAAKIKSSSKSSKSTKAPRRSR